MKIRISEKAQLFLDDYLIGRSVNVCRRMKQPIRHPANPLIVPEHPWEQPVGMNCYPAVLYDEELGRFRCWYMAGDEAGKVIADPPGLNLGKYYVCYAESQDGLHWEKLMVGKGTFAGHKKHNMVMGGGQSVCVLKTPGESDPGKRYKAAGGAIVAFSPDGINWRQHDWLKAVGKNDTCTSVIWWKGEYLAYVRNQEPETGGTIADAKTGQEWSGVMRGIGLSVSRDFLNWTAKESILRSDDRDGYPWTQVHALSVTSYGDVLIGLLPMLHILPGTGNNILGDMDVQLVVSRDGRHWARVADRAVFWPQEESGPVSERSWDMRFHVGCNMFVKDDHVYLYYGANRVRWGERSWLLGRTIYEPRPTPDMRQSDHPRLCDFGIGLATLPADRFVGLGPTNWLAEGMVQTKQLEYSGRTLLINAELGDGNVRVELVDRQGKVLAGYERGQSHLVEHDRLRYRVVWKAQGQPRSLPEAHEGDGGQGMVLRFWLRDAQLYAFQIIR